MTYLQINGTDLYSEVNGSGEPVLFLHGGFCSLESLRPQSNDLVKDHQVFAFERPGHGRSADIGEEYSYSRSLSDTITYLEMQNLESVHIVGYSDGAIIGLLLALHHPERVRSLVAISANLDPSAFADDSGEGDEATESSTENTPDPERMHYDRLSPDGPEHADIVLGKLFRLWTSEPNISPNDLSRITARTLVMAADHDTIRPDHSLLIASAIPGAQLCIVPGTSHRLVAERPELTTLLIREFLAPGTSRKQ